MSNTAKKIQMNETQQILANIKRLVFFKEFPDDLLESVAEIIEVDTLEPGQVIITQGHINSRLYFLMSGIVGVYVDGGIVATMESEGDLFGEMSIISSKRSAATVQAEEPTVLYSISANRFQSLDGVASDKFQALLYKTYAQNLTEKLRVTNQKAKHFEDMNKKLEEAQIKLQQYNLELEKKVEERTADLRKKTQLLEKSNENLSHRNAEIMASHKKLEEMYSTRDITFQKLEDLYKKHLLPLKFTLEELETNLDGTQKESIKGAGREVDDVMELLEPITSLYSVELAMRSKKVLLAETNKKQQIMAKMALGGTGVELDIVSSDEEVLEKIDGKEYDIMFVNTDLLDSTVKVKDLSPNTKYVFMTSEYIPEYLPKLQGHPFLPHIVSRDEEDRTFTIKNIVTSVTKLISADIFGLEKYLSWGVDVKESPIISSDKRDQLIDDMDQYFQQLGMRRSNRERCRTVTEELLMNAIYDAPVDENGKAIYNHLPRTEPVELDPSHQGRIRYATDGMLMAVSVEDPFGALTPDVVLTYLDSCYGGKAGELNKEKGGAGRGIHQIIENSDLVVFNVRPGHKTEVIALFNVDPKDSGNKYPSFHFFTQ